MNMVWVGKPHFAFRGMYIHVQSRRIHFDKEDKQRVMPFRRRHHSHHRWHERSSGFFIGRWLTNSSCGERLARARSR